ncbi:MAG: hypothetical protein ACK414_15240, partial [Gemmobacter sp.]
MRVLFVNWVDWRDPEGLGGGVAVYQRNLAAALAGSDVQAGFLSSGLAHDLRGGAPRWQPVPGAPGHWEIVNSAVLAPGHAAWGSPAQLADGPTEAAFAAFLAATGPWDAVQFDNIEGLPVSVLGVARAAGARVVLVLHNYYPFCSQVNFWHQERISCPGFENALAYQDGFGNRVHLVTFHNTGSPVSIVAEGVVDCTDAAGVVRGLPGLAPDAVFLRQTKATV